MESREGKHKLVFWKMPPSFTCVIKTVKNREEKDAVKFLNGLAANVTLHDLSNQLLSGAPLSALNHLLFRCEAEEKEISNNTRGPYGL